MVYIYHDIVGGRGMLFTSYYDFFDYVDKLKPLTAEEKNECVTLMNKGDEIARSKLIDNYLPFVAVIIKKYTSSKPSLELIYRSITTLNKLIDNYDLLDDNSFTRALSFKLRQVLTNFIADS